SREIEIFQRYRARRLLNESGLLPVHVDLIKNETRIHILPEWISYMEEGLTIDPEGEAYPGKVKEKYLEKGPTRKLTDIEQHKLNEYGFSRKTKRLLRGMDFDLERDAYVDPGLRATVVTRAGKLIFHPTSFLLTNELFHHML